MNTIKRCPAYASELMHIGGPATLKV